MLTPGTYYYWAHPRYGLVYSISHNETLVVDISSKLRDPVYSHYGPFESIYELVPISKEKVQFFLNLHSVSKEDQVKFLKL